MYVRFHIELMLELHRPERLGQPNVLSTSTAAHSLPNDVSVHSLTALGSCIQSLASQCYKVMKHRGTQPPASTRAKAYQGHCMMYGVCMSQGEDVIWRQATMHDARPKQSDDCRYDRFGRRTRYTLHGKLLHCMGK